ncbi:MAG: PAS domain-containing protein, partial [Myxococcales bacterium]|nr:PAS domain-containing protein [Myxococcales bacterium]
MDDRADLQRRLERLEAQLRDNQTRLRNVLEVAKVGGWELDLVRDVAVWSAETREILGVGPEAPATPETVLGRCVDDSDRAIVRDALADIRAGGSRYALTYRVFAPDGSVRVIHSRAEVRRDDQGRATRLVGIVQDVTEQEHLRAQLVQSQRLETVGRLAAGLAHDLNNMLTIIQGSCDFLEPSLVDEGARQDLATIRNASERSAALTRALLAFTRQQVLKPESLDVNEVVGSIRKMLARLVGTSVVLDLRTPRHVGYVTADREQLIQVLVNIAANARDAMPDGGRLTIVTDEAPLPDGLGSSRGRHARITLSDTGNGMAPEVLARIFDPFF